MPLKIAKEICDLKKLKEKLGNHDLDSGRQKARKPLLVMRKKEVTTQLFFEGVGGQNHFLVLTHDALPARWPGRTMFCETS